MRLATPGWAGIRGAARAASWMLVPAGIGLASRVFSTAVIVWADLQRAEVIPNPFTMWDGLWYVSISEHGYHSVPIAGPLRDIAFFPGWPVLMHLATPEGWLVPLVAPALASLLFVVACVLVWRVLADRLGPEVASPAVAFMAFSPASYVGSLAYSEPLFLCLAASAFLLRGRTLPRMVAVAAAMATRIAGSALVLAALVEALVERGRARRSALLTAAAGVAAFGAWWTFIAILQGDPFGFFLGSPSFGGMTGVLAVGDAILKPEIHGLAWLAYYAIAVAAAVLVVRRDRVLGAFAIGALALAFLPGGFVSSMPRYVLSAFPVFAGFALALRGRWAGLTLVTLAALASTQVAFLFWAVVERRAP